MTPSAPLRLALFALASTAACGTSGTVVGDVNTDAGNLAILRPDYIVGADISWVQEQEAAGAVFIDNGAEADVLTILKRHGFNTVRLRLFHSPTSACRTSVDGDETCGYQQEAPTKAEPFCDLAHTLQMAARVKASGMRLLLNLHYSDTWADPDDQNKPLAWEGLSFDALTSALSDYTRDTLERFRDADVQPDMVQLGNGITAGILFPDGASSDPNFPQFAQLLRAASTAVKEVDPNIPILLHLEKPDSFSTSDWWVSSALEHGVDFDILGQSCFTGPHGPSAGWQATFTQLADKYPKLKFMIAEYSEEKRAVNDILLNLPDRRGLGAFIWEPTQWHETLFDRDEQQFTTNPFINFYDHLGLDHGIPRLP